MLRTWEFATGHASSQIGDQEASLSRSTKKTLFATLDTPENHRLYDRMGMRSYRIPGATTAAEMNEVLNSLRSLFELRL